MAGKRSLQYVIEKDWKTSPKAQMGLFKAAMIGVTVGFVLSFALGCTPMAEKLDKAAQTKRSEFCIDRNSKP